MNKDLAELDKLFKSNQFEEVILRAKKLIKKKDKIAPYFNLLGISLDNIGKTYKAEKIFIEAIKENPKEISYYSNLAKILIKQNKLKDAEKILNDAIKIKPQDPFSLMEFGKLKNLQKKFSEGLEYFKKVYNVQPNFPNTLFLIGKTYLELFHETNDINYKNLSIENLLNSSRNFPENVDADYLLSEVSNYSEDKEHQQIMLNKLDKLLFKNRKQKSILLFSIAKSFEDQKKIDQTCEFLKMANIEMSSTKDKNLILEYSKRFENIKLLFNKIINVKFIEEQNLFKKKIICIVGMPRSGTTLLHQLIASAEGVEGVGESPIIPSFFERNIFRKEFFNQIYQNTKFNQKYLVEISNMLGESFNNSQNTKKNIIVDKNPSNFFWIGFIKLLFPNSKIIHIKRNLKDVCLSVYKNIFGVKQMDWSYNPENIIKYVQIYLKTINFWQQKYKDSIYEINYEKLINNRNDETKKLFSFCELEWSEEIFNYYKTGKSIRTASQYQVKKPIYNSSVNISENYSKYLNFLSDINKIDTAESKF